MAESEPRSRRLFSDMIARPEVDLAHAALLIACEEYPELDVEGYLSRLDAMGAEVTGRAAAAAGPEAALAALNRYMFEEQRFRGNSEDYYDPRNSYLNDVLDRRLGIPITLSTLYIEVARRAGLRVEGVGLPGHFVVRVLLPHGERLVDPFHAGALLSEGDCQARLDRIFEGKIRLEPPMLAALGPRQILARTLHNLKAIFVKNDDHTRALAVVELLLRLDPGSAEDLRDRGLLYAALDCYASAARDLEAYLALGPGPAESGELLLRAVEMRRRAARLN